MNRSNNQRHRSMARQSCVSFVMCLFLATSVSADEQFLEPEELELLQPVAEVEGLMRHQVGDTAPSDFERVLIGGVTFFFADDSKSKDIDADELKKISDALRDSLKEAAQNRWEVVEEPGPGVLQVNVGVSKIKLRNKKRGLLGFTPIGLVTTTAGNLAGMRLTLADASLQGESLDSVSGEPVTYFMVDSIGEYDDEKGMSWEDVRATLQDFATRAAQVDTPTD